MLQISVEPNPTAFLEKDGACFILFFTETNQIIHNWFCKENYFCSIDYLHLRNIFLHCPLYKCFPGSWLQVSNYRVMCTCVAGFLLTPSFNKWGCCLFAQCTQNCHSDFTATWTETVAWWSSEFVMNDVTSSKMNTNRYIIQHLQSKWDKRDGKIISKWKMKKGVCQ